MVLGLGVSGEAAAALLLAEGVAVTVVDAADLSDLRRTAETLRAAGGVVHLGVRELPRGEFTRCVISPGIAGNSPWVEDVRARGIPVVSELEVGAAHAGAPMLAVTGTNGKSTLVKLCAQSMQRAGLRAASAGNYGLPLCAVARKPAGWDWIVTEVSSFQLETTGRFGPRVAVLLNIQPNHLDRHGDPDTYADVKSRIFRDMGSGDTGIVPEELLSDVRRRSGGSCRWRTFGVSDSAEYRYRDGTVRLPPDSPWGDVRISGSAFSNPVLGPAAAAACAALEACGLDPSVVGREAEVFEPLPHRMQMVGLRQGVRFVNNSKATTLAAMGASLRMSPGPVRLIAGGLLKERDLKTVQELLVKHVERVYLIGKAAASMKAVWEDTISCRLCATLDQAVFDAWADAKAGETILLAPGCASFDQFRNFEERGKRFAELVELLRNKEA